MLGFRRPLQTMQWPTGFNRMLKKSASIVLESFRGSMYRRVRLASSLAAALPAERRVLARRGWAGEKDELVEHPELLWQQRHSVRSQRSFTYKPRFSVSC